ncbi:hypothetical protein J437_LFUL017069 [Ladona fulva]|uniref:SCAN domain-containing protein 3 n=1 Tax=Ladona fulva TaxID=123851 RepID=A0A8K0KLV4_LADFU|nr:hypothetical protein J437_LFUL017069 [Ladona fulva]
MAENVEDILRIILRTTEFALQLDESTLPGNESVLLAYVRFIKDENLSQELLFTRRLETDTKGESIFRIVEQFFRDKKFHFLTYLLRSSVNDRSSPWLYCILEKICTKCFCYSLCHRQHLVAKILSDRLHMSLNIVITAVNKIKALIIESFKSCVMKTRKILNVCYYTRKFVGYQKAIIFEEKDAFLSDNLKEIRNWVINPFVDIEEVGVLKEELIGLQNDVELKPKFKINFQERSDRYPALWMVVKKLFLAFPTSYLVERGFSAVIQLISKQRNRLQLISKQRNRLQVCERGDLRLLLSDIKVDVGKLVSGHQAHPSH